jgi:type I restriction enzyme S subunit
MNAERLLQHYEQIADAPDAIARLRRFILDLAVRGKLVPQDPADEPASELLELIAAEKARLLRAGEKQGRSLSVVKPREPITFVLPLGWELTTLGEVALKITDGAHKTPTYVDKGTHFISVKDFSGGVLDFSNTRLIPESEHKQLYQRCDPARGDIIFGRIGTLGRAVIVDTDIQFSLFVSVGLIRFDHRSMNPIFFRSLLNSPFVETEFERIKVGGGTHTNKLNLGDLHTVALPLPPLAEQHRIVAKVDELMALCDELEAAGTERETKRDRLAAASLARLNAPDPETFRDDARFALDALPALTARPDQIKQLRQTILNLAVRGKLVPQDPADEPAEELLKRIAKEKARLVEGGVIRKSRPLPAFTADNSPFEVPNGWACTRLGDVIHLVSGQHLQPPEYSEDPKAGLPYITGPSDFGAGGLEISRFALVRKAVAKQGQLLLTVKGSGVGKTTICDIPEVAISRQLMALTAIKWDDRFLLLITHRLAEKLQAEARSLIPGISREDVDEFVIPLPPLAEQHRIVAKVDELLALCYQLETSMTNADKKRKKLLDALLAEALAPVGAEALREAAE